jgi:formate hydrogenlyase subunit 6/NADH:ubiquinone oxidoreductase subunit I
MTQGAPVTRRFPQVKIDRAKCTVPYLCKKCLQICPMLVFDVDRAPERERRLEEMDPRVDGNFILWATRYDKCTACNLCIEACPVGALTLDIPPKFARPEIKAR